MSKNNLPSPAPPDARVNGTELVKPPGCPLKPVAGSDNPRFNNVLLNAVARTLWVPPGTMDDHQTDLLSAALAAVRGFNPRDEVEGMMAAQAVALHHAAMECARRAMLPDQPSEAADRLWRQAANLSRAMVDMAEAIERRRGKGPHVVRVERVVVNDGGQAIVGAVAPSPTVPRRDRGYEGE